MRESLLVALEQHAKGEDEPAAESLNEPIEQTRQILLEKQLAVLLERGGLEQDLAESDPIVVLADFLPALIEIVYIIAGFDQPIPHLHFLLLSHHDVARRQPAVHHVFGMQVQQTLDDRREGVHDFFFSEVQLSKGPFSVVNLRLEGGLLFGIEQSVVIANVAQKGWMRDWRIVGRGGGGLEVLVGFFGGLVQEEDVAWLEFYYHELFTRGGHGSVRFILFIIISINSYFI